MRLDNFPPDAYMEMGNIGGTDLHYLAMSEDCQFSPHLGPDGRKWISIQLNRQDLVWLGEAIQRELALAAVREN